MKRRLMGVVLALGGVSLVACALFVGLVLANPVFRPFLRTVAAVLLIAASGCALAVRARRPVLAAVLAAVVVVVGLSPIGCVRGSETPGSTRCVSVAGLPLPVVADVDLLALVPVLLALLLVPIAAWRLAHREEDERRG